MGGLAQHVHLLLVHNLLDCVAAVASEAESAAPVPVVLVVPHTFVVPLCPSTWAHLVDSVVLENVSTVHFCLCKTEVILGD